MSYTLPKIIYPALPALPAALDVAQVAGGALAGRTYYVRATYQTLYGETPWGAEASLAIDANKVLVATSPARSSSAAFSTGWNIYAGETTEAETKQNALPIAIGTDWTEPVTGLIAGDAPPATWGTTLEFQREPRFVPSFSFEAVRHDNRASSGVQESVFERLDEFLEFAMEYVGIGTDVDAWQAFLRVALQGVPFDFYPDADGLSYVTYFLDDMAAQAAYKVPGQFGLPGQSASSVRFYRRVVWP